MRKILFLDIDGVVNCSLTTARHGGYIGIDPFMSLLVDRIIQATGCEVVLSSSWRHMEDGREEVRQKVCKFIDVTPSSMHMSCRGEEIQDWLDRHPDVTKFAILDDNSDMLESQKPSFFQTSWETGLTEPVMQKVINHLNAPHETN